MIMLDYKNLSVSSGKAAEMAFCAAFFFLPLSKPLMFISLAVAFVLFLVSDRFSASRAYVWSLPWFKPALILCALPLLALLVHPGRMHQGFPYLNLSYYWLLAFITFLAATQMRIQLWMRAFTFGVFIVFCYTQIRFHGDTVIAKGMAAQANHILYSQFLAVAVVLLSILFKDESRHGWKIIYVVGMTLLFYGLVTGNGRSGLLALVLLLPMILGNLFPRLRLSRILVACAVVVAIALAVPTVQNRIRDGVNDMKLFERNVTTTSLGYRFEMWSTARDVFLEHPIIGAGPYGFSVAWHAEPRAPEAEAFREPHNAYFFFASSYGLIGVGVLLWLYTALLWTGWRTRHSVAGAAVLAFSVFLISGSLTNTMFMGAASHAMVMLFIGLQGGVARTTIAARKANGDVVPAK